jgi:hypothetical protein
MGVFANTPVIPSKWDSPGPPVGGKKPDIKNILLNLETIYKDIYRQCAWDNDGNMQYVTDIESALFSGSTLTTGEAIGKYNACYIKPNTYGSVFKAQANSIEKSRCILMSTATLASGEQSRQFIRRGMLRMLGQGGWSPGSPVYLDWVTAGQGNPKQPTSAEASVLHQIGIYIGASLFDFRPYMRYEIL